MIYKERKRCEIIQSHNPIEVKERYERLMEEIAGKEPEEFTGYDASIGHYAHIKWMERIREPEDARDRAYLNNVQYCCGQCPYFVLAHDRRVKHSVCGHGEKVWYDRTACNYLYEQIEKGKIQLD